MLVIAAVGPVKSNLSSSGGLNIFPKRQSSSRPGLQWFLLQIHPQRWEVAICLHRVAFRKLSQDCINPWAKNTVLTPQAHIHTGQRDMKHLPTFQELCGRRWPTWPWKRAATQQKKVGGVKQKINHWNIKNCYYYVYICALMWMRFSAKSFLVTLFIGHCATILCCYLANVKIWHFLRCGLIISDAFLSQAPQVCTRSAITSQ